MMRNPLASYSTAILCSLSLHGVLVALLVVGWTPEHKPKVVKPRYIEAKLLQLEPKATPKPKPKSLPKPVDNSAATRKEEQQRKEEAQRKEAQRQKELQRKQEQARKEAERKRKAEAERKEKERREAEQRRKAEEERKRRQKEEELARALAAEEEFLDTLDDQEAIGSYTDYIRNRIESNWSRPPSARRDMEVELEIQLVPTGRVVSVSIVKSSGNAALDRSAEQAVHKVGQFDKLRGMEQRLFESNFRRFRMKFSPEDLRL